MKKLILVAVLCSLPLVSCGPRKTGCGMDPKSCGYCRENTDEIKCPYLKEKCAAKKDCSCEHKCEAAKSSCKGCGEKSCGKH